MTKKVSEVYFLKNALKVNALPNALPYALPQRCLKNSCRIPDKGAIFTITTKKTIQNTPVIHTLQEKIKHKSLIISVNISYVCELTHAPSPLRLFDLTVCPLAHDVDCG